MLHLEKFKISNFMVYACIYRFLKLPFVSVILCASEAYEHIGNRKMTFNPKVIGLVLYTEYDRKTAVDWRMTSALWSLLEFY